MSVCEPGVVEPQAVEDGGLQVVNVDRVFSHVEAQVVGLPRERSRLECRRLPSTC